MSFAPVFLTREVIDNLHADSLASSAAVLEFVTMALSSPLGSAQNAWLYGQGDLFEVAAAMLSTFPKPRH